MKFFEIETLGNPNDDSLCFFRSVVVGTERDSANYVLGKRLLPAYPKEPKLFMGREDRGVKLMDFIGNTENMFLVSKGFREAIEKHCQGVDIEYLPVTLYDHRKRVHSQDYTIVNPIGTFDCLDVAASGVRYGPEGGVIHIRELVMDRNKVKDAPQFFRVQHEPSRYIIGIELAREIYDRGFTNVLWTELSINGSPDTVT